LKTSKYPTRNRTRDLLSCGTVLAPFILYKTVCFNRNIIPYFASKCGEATLLSILSKSTVSLQKRQFQHLASRQDFTQTDGQLQLVILLYSSTNHFRSAAFATVKLNRSFSLQDFFRTTQNIVYSVRSMNRHRQTFSI